MIGDVIFFKKSSSFISRIIAYNTKSEYTHVGIIVAYDEFTNVATIIESDRFVNTRINRIELEIEKHVVFTTGEKTEETRELITKFAYEHLGTEYDYFQIFGILISLLLKGGRFFNSANKFICSELIDLAYYKAGEKRLTDMNIGNVTPQELLEVYDFRIRN